MKLFLSLSEELKIAQIGAELVKIHRNDNIFSPKNYYQIKENFAQVTLE